MNEIEGAFDADGARLRRHKSPIRPAELFSIRCAPEDCRLPPCPERRKMPTADPDGIRGSVSNQFIELRPPRAPWIWQGLPADLIVYLVNSFLISQMFYNTSIQFHTHNSPFFGIPVGLSPSLQATNPQASIDLVTKCTIGLFNHKINMAMLRLRNLSPAGKNYINSLYNNTN